MNEIFRWLNLARPFLEEAYAVALLINPQAAQEVRVIIDAIERLANVPVDPNQPVTARGYEAIKLFGDAVISAMTALETADIEHDEKVRQATDLNNSLYDPTKVYQAQHGDDAALLQGYKAQAKQILGEITNE